MSAWDNGLFGWLRSLWGLVNASRIEGDTWTKRGKHQATKMRAGRLKAAKKRGRR